MNLVRFNHPGFSHFFENIEKTHNVFEWFSGLEALKVASR